MNIEQEVLIVVIEAMKKYEILYNSSPSVYENKDKRMATWHFVFFCEATAYFTLRSYSVTQLRIQHNSVDF